MLSSTLWQRRLGTDDIALLNSSSFKDTCSSSCISLARPFRRVFQSLHSTGRSTTHMSQPPISPENDVRVPLPSVMPNRCRGCRNPNTTVCTADGSSMRGRHVGDDRPVNALAPTDRNIAPSTKCTPFRTMMYCLILFTSRLGLLCLAPHGWSVAGAS